MPYQVGCLNAGQHEVNFVCYVLQEMLLDIWNVGKWMCVGKLTDICPLHVMDVKTLGNSGFCPVEQFITHIVFNKTI